MVYMGNIIQEHKELSSGYEIVLRFRSNGILTIQKEDKIIKIQGDLKVLRYYKGKHLCTMYIDSAEVESFIIKKGE